MKATRTVHIALPMIGILPLIQAVFGIGITARVIVVFVVAFIYVTLNAEVGAALSNPEHAVLVHSRGVRIPGRSEQPAESEADVKVATRRQLRQPVILRKGHRRCPPI